MQITRKILMILSCALLLSVDLKAQNAPKDSSVKTLKISIPFHLKSVFSLGFKVNLNTIFWKDNLSYFTNRSYYSVNTIGLSSVVEWQFLKHLSIGVEPTYVRNSFDNYESIFSFFEILKPDCGNGLPRYLAFNAHYIALPILLKARFPIFKNKALISSEIGWSSQWLVSSSAIKNANVFEYEGYEEFVKSSINTFDHGLNVGIGLSIPLKKGFVDVNTRYYMGKKDVTQMINDSKTQILTYQLGYRFIL
jgi:Outer membrane protein beta-barrel domain